MLPRAISAASSEAVISSSLGRSLTGTRYLQNAHPRVLPVSCLARRPGQHLSTLKPVRALYTLTMNRCPPRPYRYPPECPCCWQVLAVLQPFVGAKHPKWHANKGLFTHGRLRRHSSGLLSTDPKQKAPAYFQTGAFNFSDCCPDQSPVDRLIVLPTLGINQTYLAALFLRRPANAPAPITVSSIKPAAGTGTAETVTRFWLRVGVSWLSRKVIRHLRPPS